MPNTSSVVAVCVGIFSLTMRYTGWFQVKHAWFVTVAAGLVEVWAVLSLIFCSINFVEMIIIVFSTLLALISHGCRALTGDKSSVARTRITINSLVCSYYLAMQLFQKQGETCDIISITMPSFIFVFLFVDMYMVHEVSEPFNRVDCFI